MRYITIFFLPLTYHFIYICIEFLIYHLTLLLRLDFTDRTSLRKLYPLFNFEFDRTAHMIELKGRSVKGITFRARFNRPPRRRVKKLRTIAERFPGYISAQGNFTSLQEAKKFVFLILFRKYLKKQIKFWDGK
jgi:hypothetical protein